MKLLVCGGRDFADRDLVFDALDTIHAETPISTVVHGACRTALYDGTIVGADYFASCWASKRDVEIRAYPADWKTHGRAAGPIRNQQMLDEECPDIVVAFAGGRGTEDMCRRARDAGVRVIEVASASKEGLWLRGESLRLR